MALKNNIDVEEIKKIQPILDQAIEHHKQGNISKAAEIYLDILNRVPDHPDALHLLGVTMYLRGKYIDAEQLIRKAINSNPDTAEYHNSLGNVLAKLGFHQESVENYKNALSINPYYFEAYSNFMRNAVDIQEYEIIIEKLKNIVTERNKDSIAYLTIANAFRRQGKFNDAVANYEKSIFYEPNQIDSYIGLTSVKKFTHEDKQIIDKMNGLSNDSHLSNKIRSNLLFSLGKIYDDMGDYDTAFLNYKKANEMVKNEYNRAKIELYFIRIKKSFNKILLKKNIEAASDSNKPIFIVGMPRSGSTLIEQVLSTNRGVYSAGEITALSDNIKFLPNILKTSREYPRCVSKISEEVISKITNKYLEFLNKYPSGCTRVIDKNLDNYFHLGLINVMFRAPNIIHTKRNKLDNCLSIYFQSVYEDLPNHYSYDLGDIGYYYRLYENLMNYWEEILPNNFITINYEKHIHSPEKTHQMIFDYCNLKYADACNEFYKSDRLIMTKSVWQVRQPIYLSSIDRWKNYEKFLEPLRKELQI